jgi:NTP pyrophosphatase (non-canonical NTP hydrolase)
MKLNEFHEKVLLRQREAFAGNMHTRESAILSLVSEVGELAEAAVGVGNHEERKRHLTEADVADAIGDIATYLSLVAHKYGIHDLEAVLARVFNFVSERSGSAYRVGHDANV